MCRYSKDFDVTSHNTSQNTPVCRDCIRLHHTRMQTPLRWCKNLALTQRHQHQQRVIGFLFLCHSKCLSHLRTPQPTNTLKILEAIHDYVAPHGCGGNVGFAQYKLLAFGWQSLIVRIGHPLAHPQPSDDGSDSAPVTAVFDSLFVGLGWGRL